MSVYFNVRLAFVSCPPSQPHSDGPFLPPLHSHSTTDLVAELYSSLARILLQTLDAAAAQEESAAIFLLRIALKTARAAQAATSTTALSMVGCVWVVCGCVGVWEYRLLLLLLLLHHQYSLFSRSSKHTRSAFAPVDGVANTG